MTVILLHSIAALHTGPSDAEPIRNAMLLVRGNRIAHLGPMADGLPNGLLAEGEPVERFDLSGCVVTPGLVNTHHHFYQHLTRAMPSALRARPLDWLYASYPLWAGLDAEMLRAATKAAVAELLLSGCTTAADCAYLLPGDDGPLAAALVEAASEMGIRLHFHRGCMPTLEGDLETRLADVMGHQSAARLIDADEDQLMRRLERAIAAHHDADPMSMCRVALGPTGVTYTRPGLMRKLADLAAEAGLGLHTHFHPRPDEDAKAAPEAPIAFLARHGWLKPGTWLAHGTRLKPQEVRILADAGVGVAHCPRTIVRLGFGLAPVGSWRQAGLAVGLGVDGAASNDQGNLLSDLRLAAVLHRVTEPPDHWLTAADALEMATADGARALNRPQIGRLVPGLAADIAAFRIDGLDCAGAVSDPLSALLFAGTEVRAWLTIVNGRVRVWERRLVDADEAAIARELNDQARRMLALCKAATGIDFSRADALAG